MADDEKKTPKRKLTPDEKVAKAQQVIERAKATIAKATETTRAYDSRRKIVIGAMLLKAASEEARFAPAMKTLVDRLKDSDKELFKGFAYYVDHPAATTSPSSPSPSPSPSPSSPSSVEPATATVSVMR